MPSRDDKRRTLGAILAGGAGQRVGGQDKGLLPLLARPLIGHVVDALRAQCDGLLIVANRNGNVYAGYAPVIVDEVSGHAGPLAGIVAALRHLEITEESATTPRCDWLLTVPVDCPRPPHDLSSRLREALAGTPDTPCAFAHDGRGPQPLFALYRPGLAAAAREALATHASPQRWHQEIDALAVDFSDCAAAFHNLNSPQDFHDYEHTYDES